MFHNFKIRTKILIGFGTAIAFLLISIAFSLLGVQVTAQSLDDFYGGPYYLTNQIQEIGSDVQSVSTDLILACATEDTAVTTASIQAANEELDEVYQEIVAMEQNVPFSQTEVTAIREGIEATAELVAQVEELAVSNQTTQAVNTFVNKLQPLALEILQNIEQVKEAATENAQLYVKAGHNTKQHALILQSALGLIAVGIALFLATKITVGITHPIQQLRTAMGHLVNTELHKINVEYQSEDELGVLAEDIRSTVHMLDTYISDISSMMARLAQGDLNVQAQADFKGDMAPLRDSIMQTVQAFDNALSQINASADQVSGGSEQVSSISQSLSQGAAEQASTVEQLSNMMAEAAAQMRNSADKAGHASQKASAVGNEMNTSDQQMQQMMQAMQEISNSSNEIGKIIKAIEDIAFQTNILALNAAVEAARAGVAGKGFAVVADEVRSLASKSGQASKETAALIERSMNAVRNGMGIAGETAKTLQISVEGMQEIVNTINEIAENAHGQSEGIEQISEGVQQIARVVQNNSATAEESAAASEELSTQSHLLKSLVGKFELRGASKETSENLVNPHTAPTLPSEAGTSKYA